MASNMRLLHICEAMRTLNPEITMYLIISALKISSCLHEVV